MKKVALAIQGILLALFAILVIAILGNIVSYEKTKYFFYALIVSNVLVNLIFMRLIAKHDRDNQGRY